MGECGYGGQKDDHKRGPQKRLHQYTVRILEII